MKMKKQMLVDALGHAWFALGMDDFEDWEELDAERAAKIFGELVSALEVVLEFMQAPTETMRGVNFRPKKDPYKIIRPEASLVASRSFRADVHLHRHPGDPGPRKVSYHDLSCGTPECGGC